MRVIRTEMYFDPASIEGLGWRTHSKNPGLSVAWFGSQMHEWTNGVQVPDFRTITTFAEGNDQLIEVFLSTSLQGATGSRAIRLLQSGLVSNRDVVQYVLSQPIVVERSPPEAIPFLKLMGKNAHVAIGTYIGVSIAGGNPLIMLVSVPGGILVVGAAISVSKAIDKGINKSIEKLFKRRR